MPNNVSVKITDNTDLVRRATDAAIERGLEAAGITIEAYAKLQTPVDTGRLRNSITHATKTDRGKDTYIDDAGNTYEGGSARGFPEEKTVYVGTNVEYAPYVEMGTTKTVAQPFLRPAATEHVDELKKLFEAELKKG